MRRTPDWVWRLHAEVARYAIPFTFGRPPNPREQPGIHAATCVAVETVHSRFIITARHVAEPARDAVQTSPAECLAGRVRLGLDQIALSDASLDLATIPVTETHVRLLEADGYRVVRPDAWPPASELLMNDPILAVGFPGAWRLHLSWDEIDFRSVTKLALVHQLGSGQFACQLDPAFVERYEVGDPDSLPAEQLPGMSGGPGFLVRQDLIIVPRLCGVIKHGLDLGDGNQIIYFAPLNKIQSNGAIAAAP